MEDNKKILIIRFNAIGDVAMSTIIPLAIKQKHPNCKNMYCFVYDPEGRIRNPKGIEKDLTRETDGIQVFTYIYPR